MKRGWKIFWMVCGICGGAGILLCAISLALGVSVEAIEERYPDGFSFPFHIRRSVGFTEYDYEDPGDVEIIQGENTQKYVGVRSVDLYIAAGQVEIRTAEKGVTDIVVKTEKVDRRLKLKNYMEGNTLVIRTKKNITGLSHAGDVGTIWLYVPEDYLFDEADLDVRAGSLKVEDIRAKELTVNVGAGEASVENFVADEADLDCGTGSLTLAGEVRESVDIDCGVGKIAFTVKGKEEDYNYNIDCGIGEVTCGEMIHSGVAFDKEVDNGASREMDIDCGIGEVTIHFE